MGTSDVDHFAPPLLRTGRAVQASGRPIEIRDPALVCPTQPDYNAGKDSARVVRHLRTLHAAGDALLQAGDEISLIDAICGAVTASGGYHVAWAGLSDGGDFTVIRPLAWSGRALTSFRAAWAATSGMPWGSGLVSAPSDGTPSLLSLAVPSVAVSPWWREALCRGFGAAASFPLMVSDGMVGSMTVLARATRDFDFTDIELLRLVAGKLSYGIAALRDRAARAVSAQQLVDGIEASVVAIAAMLEERDPYTAGHQRRTAQLAVAIAREMNLPDDRVQGIRLGSLIHDVGKIAAPAEILYRPGKLSSAQMEIVKTHARVGYDIVRHIAFPWPIAEMVLQHHERLDGSGYPQGLAGDAILLDARIIAVADVVEAITSFRPYRPALGSDVALAEVEMHAGTRFDLEVVTACSAVFRQRGFPFASGDDLIFHSAR